MRKAKMSARERLRVEGRRLRREKMEGRETTAVGCERACPVQRKSSAPKPTYLLLPYYLPKITQMSARVYCSECMC